jgi:hypothetical protein
VLRAPRNLRPGGAPDGETAAAGRREKAEDPARVSGFLRALDGAPDGPPESGGGSGEAAKGPAGEPNPEAEAQSPKGKDRRAGLLERITRMEKPVASGG